MRKRSTTALIAALSTMGLVVAMSSSGATGASTPGSLDPTFGKGGKVVGVPGALPTDALIMPNGDILVSMELEGSYAVARYTASGALDSSFGISGIAKAPPISSVAGSPTVEGTADALALDPSGRIVVVGGARAANGASAFGVVRFSASGRLDTTFGTDGEAVTISAEEGLISADTVLVEPSDQILVGGYRLQGGRPTKTFGLIMRFNANGTLDSTFGKAGQATLPSTAGDVDALGIDASENIFALTSLTAAQTELSPIGRIDASATPAAIASRSVGGFGAFDLPRTFLGDGRSLEAHSVTTSRRGYKVQVQRWSAAGSLDSTFSNSLFRYTGETTTLGKDHAAEAVVAPSGKVIVVGGHTPEGTPAGTSVLGVERLDSNGALDSTFGNGGGVTTSFAENSNSSAVAAIVQPDEKIVVVGLSFKGEAQNLVLARYLG